MSTNDPINEIFSVHDQNEFFYDILQAESPSIDSNAQLYDFPSLSIFPRTEPMNSTELSQQKTNEVPFNHLDSCYLQASAMDKSKNLSKMNMAPNQQINSGRIKFSSSEDRLLISLVQSYGTKSWVLVSKMMNNRTPRQCRDRWNHYLSPTTNNTLWSPEEDTLLIEKIKIFGNQWSRISKFFPGRTGVSIRNRCCKLSRQPSSDPFLKKILIETPQKMN